MSNEKWVNIGVAIKSLSGKAVTLVLPQGKLYISVNQLLSVVSGHRDYACVGFLIGDKISKREKKIMEKAFYRIVRQVSQHTHKAFLRSLSEEEKQVLGMK